MADAAIPLTTTFTPPHDCLESLTLDYSTPYYILGAADSCRPSGAGTSGDTQYFSPGLWCPSGWTTAGTTTITAGDVYETRATCCPQLEEASFSHEMYMYAVGDNYAYGCTGWAVAPFTYLSVPSGASEPLTTEATSPADVYTTGSAQHSTIYTYTAYAQPVHLAWQWPDRHSYSSSSPPAATATPSAKATGSDSTRGGLAKTGKIVIGVVVPVVVLALLALGCFIIRRRKAGKPSTTHEIQQEVVHGVYVNPVKPKTHDTYGTPKNGLTDVHGGGGVEEDVPRRWSGVNDGYGSRSTTLPSYGSPDSSSR